MRVDGHNLYKWELERMDRGEEAVIVVVWSMHDYLVIYIEDDTLFSKDWAMNTALLQCTGNEWSCGTILVS
jgi:hypothetical protein